MFMPAGTFRGCFKRHARLHKLCSDGEMFPQVCRNFVRTFQKACRAGKTLFRRRNVFSRLAADRGRPLKCPVHARTNVCLYGVLGTLGSIRTRQQRRPTTAVYTAEVAGASLTRSSRAILPSRMLMMRWAYAAMSRSCVTRMMVLPSA